MLEGSDVAYLSDDNIKGALHVYKLICFVIALLFLVSKTTGTLKYKISIKNLVFPHLSFLACQTLSVPNNSFKRVYY